MASKQIWIFSTRDRMECCKNILQKMADLKTLGIGTVCRLGFDSWKRNITFIFLLKTSFLLKGLLGEDTFKM